jgi:hypothetical protein
VSLFLFSFLSVCWYSPRRAFTLLNSLFAEFDSEVLALRMFKYHHIYNTYLVCSPSAALEVLNTKP